MQLSLVQLLQKYSMTYMYKTEKTYNASGIMNQKYVLKLLCPVPTVDNLHVGWILIELYACLLLRYFGHFCRDVSVIYPNSIIKTRHNSMQQSRGHQSTMWVTLRSFLEIALNDQCLTWMNIINY